MTEPRDHQALVEAAEQAAASGDYTSAEPLLRQAAEVQEATLGPSPELANTLNNLGVLYEMLGRGDDAEGSYRRAYDIARATLPPDHPFVATSGQNLRECVAARGGSLDLPPLADATVAPAPPIVGAVVDAQPASASDVVVEPPVSALPAPQQEIPAVAPVQILAPPEEIRTTQPERPAPEAVTPASQPKSPAPPQKSSKSTRKVPAPRQERPASQPKVKPPEPERPASQPTIAPPAQRAPISQPAIPEPPPAVSASPSPPPPQSRRTLAIVAICGAVLLLIAFVVMRVWFSPTAGAGFSPEPGPTPAAAATPAPVTTAPAIATATDAVSAAPTPPPESPSPATPSSSRAPESTAPAATVASTAPASPPPTASSSSVRVAEAQLCTSLPTAGARAWRCDPAGSSVGPGRFFFYTRLESATDTIVEHRWYRGNRLHQRVELHVRANPGSGYRTFSRQTVTAPTAGDWRVELVAQDGTVLSEQRFAVQ